MTQQPFEHKKYGAVEAIASTNSGNLYVPFIDRTPQEKKSEVAITRCLNYSQAGAAVREAIHLLGGIERFCRAGDVVIIKPNIVFGVPWEMAETTHPAVVSEVVKAFKEGGAVVKILERPAFNTPARIAYEISGIGKAALEAGVDELLDWAEEEYVEVRVPNSRSFSKVNIPKSLMEADLFVDLPKLKNNFVLGPGALTLSIKSKLGLVPQEDRELVHRTPVDMAAACCDIAKAINHKHSLSLVDGVYAMEGASHYGTICKPGVIVASPDLVAVEAVCHAIVGYHPLESPAVQLAMKDGLGTADFFEIDILGTRIRDVYYPFVRSLTRYVQKYTNVTEYFGGTCPACLLAMMAVPPFVDPQKKYAIVAGTRALVAEPLSDIDEVYLVGQCACRADHQFPGFMNKVKMAKKVIRMGTCPGHETVHRRKWGGVYDARMLLSVDMTAGFCLPDTVRPSVLKAGYERREKGKLA